MASSKGLLVDVDDFIEVMPACLANGIIEDRALNEFFDERPGILAADQLQLEVAEVDSTGGVELRNEIQRRRGVLPEERSPTEVTRCVASEASTSSFDYGVDEGHEIVKGHVAQ